MAIGVTHIGTTGVGTIGAGTTAGITVTTTGIGAGVGTAGVIAILSGMVVIMAGDILGAMDM